MAVVIPTNPAVDPSFLAFLRSQGIEESDIQGEIARRTSQITRGLERRQPVYADQMERGLEQDAHSFEDRGLYRSGARLVAQQRTATDIDRARLEDESGVRDQIANLEQSGAAQVAALRRQTAEQEMNTRTGLV